MKQRLTVGMATYNGVETVIESIKSLQNQSYTDYSVLISDDASTDKTAETIRNFIKDDNRISLHKQITNLGPLQNFIYLLNNCHTEYFMWASQDDLWSKNYLALSVAALDENIDSSYTLPKSVCKSWNFPFVRRINLPTLEFLCRENSEERLLKYTELPFSSFKDNITYGVYRTEKLKKCMQALEGKLRYFSIGCIHNEYVIQYLKAVFTPEAILYKRYRYFPPGYWAIKVLHKIKGCVFGNEIKNTKYSSEDFFIDLVTVMNLSNASAELTAKVVDLNFKRSEFKW